MIRYGYRALNIGLNMGLGFSGIVIVYIGEGDV